MNKLTKYISILILLLAVNQQGFAMDESDDRAIAQALQDEEMARELQRKEEQATRQFEADAKLAQSLQKQLNQPGKGPAHPRPATAPAPRPRPNAQPARPKTAAPRPHVPPTRPKTAAVPRKGGAQVHADPAKSAAQGTIALPAALNGSNIVQLTVKVQGADECGFHATLNARAIQSLIEDNQPITAAAVRERAGNYSEFIQQRQLTCPDVRDFAQEMGLKRAIIIAFNNGESTNDRKEKRTYFAANGERLQLYYLAEHTVDVTDIARSLDYFFVNIIPYLEAQNARDFHFLCNTGGHWVSISAVREAGNQIKLYYCNSSNAPLLIDSSSFGFVTFVRHMLDQLLGR